MDKTTCLTEEALILLATESEIKPLESFSIGRGWDLLVSSNSKYLIWIWRATATPSKWMFRLKEDNQRGLIFSYFLWVSEWAIRNLFFARAEYLLERKNVSFERWLLSRINTALPPLKQAYSRANWLRNQVLERNQEILHLSLFFLFSTTIKPPLLNSASSIRPKSKSKSNQIPET